LSSLPLPGAFKISQADAELLSRRTTTDNPEAEPRILDCIPVDGQNPVITLSYDLPKGIEVRCRHCRKVRKKPNHRHGYVIRYANGDGILVGNKCGADHYKDEWGIILGTRNREQSRRQATFRLIELGDNWPIIRTELFQFSDSPMWGIHDTMSQNFREKLPRLNAFVGRMLTERGGELHVMGRYRDLKAEEKQPEHKKEQVFKWRERGMGNIGGREFIAGIGSLKVTFEDYRAKLITEVEALGEVGSDLNTDDLNKRLRTVNVLFKQIRAAVDRVRSLQQFLDPDHLRRLCLCATDWSKHRNGRDQYKFDGKNIIWSGGDGVPVKCPVQPFEIPSTKRLQMYIGP